MKTFVVLALGLCLAACGGSNSTPTSPSPSPSPSPQPMTLTGVWVGTASDSTTSMMGGGMMGGGSMMNGMSWQLSQDGTTVAGSMGFSEYQSGMMGAVSGTVSGNTLTFTMTMPMGSMPMAGCSATANGTMQMNLSGKEMTGTYSGSDSCSGPFTNGQMTMTRR